MSPAITAPSSRDAAHGLRIVALISMLPLLQIRAVIAGAAVGAQPGRDPEMRSDDRHPPWGCGFHSHPNLTASTFVELAIDLMVTRRATFWLPLPLKLLTILAWMRYVAPGARKVVRYVPAT